MNLIVRKYKMTVATHKTAAVMVSPRRAGSLSSSVSQRVYIINSTVRLRSCTLIGWNMLAFECKFNRDRFINAQRVGVW